MLKRLLAIAAAATFVTGCGVRTPPATIPTFTDVMASVATITTSNGRPYCTASRINAILDYWLTADHCTQIGGGMYILGEPAGAVMRDVLNDIAIVRGCACNKTLGVPVLPISLTPPKPGDPITLAGFSGMLDMRGPIVTRGWVAHTGIQVWENDNDPSWNRPLMLIQLVGSPGTSGSPILNARMEIVSIMQGGWRREWQPIGLGATYEQLVVYKDYWLEVSGSE